MTAPRRPAQPGTPGAQPDPVRRRWRDYWTPAGRRPVAEFIDTLSDSDAAAVLAGMAEVRDRGTGRPSS